MSFTSPEFILFCGVAFALYWLCRGTLFRNLLLIASSLVFYGMFDVRFCVLLIGVVLVSYVIARCIRVMQGGSKKLLLKVGIFSLVGSLVFFKYANFGLQTINDLMSVIGRDAELHTLNILLPIGLSFYTFMAIGIGKLFGFRLARNFACPYFATNVADFWRRWHMSLTTWLRDYIYIPLGGSRCRKAKIVRNTIVVFAVSGLWHGANWTFVSWGVLHGLCLAMLVMGRGNRPFESVSRRFPPLAKWTMTFFFVTLAWVFFRADSMQQAIACLSGLFGGSLGRIPSGTLMTIPWIALMFGAEWLMRQREHALDIRGSVVVRWSVYALLVFVIFAFHPRTAEFIYAQF